VTEVSVLLFYYFTTVTDIPLGGPFPHPRLSVTLLLASSQRAAQAQRRSEQNVLSSVQRAGEHVNFLFVLGKTKTHYQGGLAALAAVNIARGSTCVASPMMA